MTSRPAAVPRINPGALVRPRLLALLDRWKPLTLVVAPSGSGKGVLAVQWAAHAQARGEQVLWFDGEVDGVEDLVATLCRFAGDDAPEDPVVGLRRLRRSMQGLSSRVALVIDNAEALVRAVGPGLVELVRDCPDVHVVACLGQRLEAVTKALLEVETQVVGVADLQFRTDEVQALAGLHGAECTLEEAEAIGLSVAGWPALLGAGFAPGVAGAAGTLPGWSAIQVRVFLGVELQARLSASGWAALRRAGLVVQPTAGAVLRATGPLDDEARHTLERVGVLDPGVGHTEPTVRLPSLLRDLLRERYLEAELGPLAVVHRAVVGHWLEHDLPEHALDQAVEGEVWSAAVDVIEEHWWRLLMESPGGLVAALGELPAASVQGRPNTEVLRQIMLPGSPVQESAHTRALVEDLRSIDPQDQAAQVTRATGAGLSRDLDLITLLVTRARLLGDVEEVVLLATRTEALLAAVEGGTSGLVLGPARRAALQSGVAWMLVGDTSRATSALQRAAGSLAVHDQVTADAAGKLALLAGMHGDLGAARRWQDRWAAARRGDSFFGFFMDFGAIASEAITSLHALRADDTRAALSRLRHEGAGTLDELWAYAAVVETYHALAWGGGDVLRSEISTARDALGVRVRLPGVATLLGCCEADLSLALGRTTAAERILAELDPGATMVLVSRARLACVTGRVEDALTLLAPVVQGRHPFAPLRLEALLLSAWCHDLAGRANDAGQLLEAAVEVGRRDRLAIHFSRVPADLLRRHAARVPVLTELLGMLADAGVQHPFGQIEDPPQLSPREAAVLRCLARGLSRVATARELFVSQNTVKSQTAAVYRKLGVKDRGDAVRRGYELGLLD